MKKVPIKSIARVGLVLLIVGLMLLVSSCGLTKSVFKKKTDTDFTEQVITKTTRIGDTVYYVVPKVKLKDTTIYTYNRQGTRLEVRYDSQGQIDLAQCIASAVEEMKEENRRFLQSQSEKVKDEAVDTNINWTWIVLGIFGIVAVIVFKKL